ncbi:GNAT family N-acetyltransferase [Nocardia otitidiscaviarum]|uniref:GNAT family N-acetyltransferase n=1 Tax=Nocardia otitidiscaviarum TaxID=1823 RepID=A0A516NKU0_9NOCA|nr:GNAT family N-acetyltransferase [Nocardia otitidiscaviarum]MCP9618837.1 GNAT family N-acetyltransferase [Nocardia otitidiscaviarum]QDP79520.1 GNAT family N-acetyltransferase [Nocardia otitidiscaviarum]
MTRTDRIGPDTPASAANREALRAELADVLRHEPASLPDTARLVEDLGVDSLGMMTLSAWLVSHGVRVRTDQGRRGTVGDLLSLAESVAGQRVELTIRAPDGSSSGPHRVPSPPPPPADPLAPVLETSVFRLDALQPADTEYLYALAVRPENCFRWRYRGVPPAPERFVEELWAQVLTQFLVRRVDDKQPAGHVVAYSADRSFGHAYVGAVFEPRYAGTGLAAEVTALFVRYLFHTFPFRKLYLEVPGYNWPRLSSGEGRYFRIEGRLRDHVYYAGRHWDQYVCAVYADQSSGEPTSDRKERKPS